MKDLQNFIEQNLPDRFKKLKVFRLPVKYNNNPMWACFKNGVWEFKPAEVTITPILTYEDSDYSGDTLNVYSLEDECTEGENDGREEAIKEYCEHDVENTVEVYTTYNGIATFHRKYDSKKRKPLIFRTIICILSVLSGNFICGIIGAVNSIKATSNKDNAVDYWHYRKMSTWHTFISWLHIITVIFMVILWATGMLFAIGILSQIGGV